MISVVCASIGRPSTWLTVEPFLDVPQIQEIIIVLPPLEDDYRQIPSSIRNHPKILLLQSQSKGQVFQRITGIREASNNLVLMIDDDISISKDSTIALIDRYQDLSRSYNNVCLAPRLLLSNHHKSTKPNASSRNSFSLNCLRLLDTLLQTGSEQYGHILFYFPAVSEPNPCNDQNFLPGAILLTQKQILPQFNYYPWSGKAYCEDVFLSSSLKSRQARLVVDDTITASTKYERRTTYECLITFQRIFIHSLIRENSFRTLYLITIFIPIFLIFCIYLVFRSLSIYVKSL